MSGRIGGPHFLETVTNVSHRRKGCHTAGKRLTQNQVGMGRGINIATSLESKKVGFKFIWLDQKAKKWTAPRLKHRGNE